MRRDQLQRYFKYFYIYLHHLTFKKVINLLKIECKLLTNDPYVKDLYPHTLWVEISNKCNLSCPLCQMGRRETVDRESRMNLANYKRFITPLKEYLFQVLLYDWGEPFLNSDIYDIIRFNTQNNIGSIVSTNCNIPIDAYRLIDSGLEYLIISGDGVTQEVYSKYRKGGDIEKVFSNLQSLVKAKKERGARFPIIEWQCLVTRYNESQLGNIKKVVLGKGVDYIRFANINFFSADSGSDIQKEWLPNDARYRRFSWKRINDKRKKMKRKPCFWLWRTAIVNVNGGVTPCCLYDVPDWGNAFEEDFLTVWNNEVFHEARTRSKNDKSLHKTDIICDRCKAPFIYV